MKKNSINNIANNLKNNLNFKLEKVSPSIDILAVVFIVVLISVLSSNKEIPEYSNISFLLALIVLISCYSVEIGIVVVVIAIAFVIFQKCIQKPEENFHGGNHYNKNQGCNPGHYGSCGENN